MISRTEADNLVSTFLRKLETPELTFIVNSEKVIERSFGWVYFYNSKKFLETHDIQYRLAGNGPIVVNKKTGAVVPLRTNKPVQALIDEYEQSLR